MDSGIEAECDLERVDWNWRRRGGERSGEKRESESESERAGACGKVGVACGEVYGLY